MNESNEKERKRDENTSSFWILQLKERELELEQTITTSKGIKGIKYKCEQEEKERTFLENKKKNSLWIRLFVLWMMLLLLSVCESKSHLFWNITLKWCKRRFFGPFHYEILPYGELFLLLNQKYRSFENIHGFWWARHSYLNI